MDTVSQKYYFKLNEQLSCEHVCQELQKLVTKFQKHQGQDLSNSLLIIEIKNIVQTVDETICKLEFKN